MFNFVALMVFGILEINRLFQLFRVKLKRISVNFAVDCLQLFAAFDVWHKYTYRDAKAVFDFPDQKIPIFDITILKPNG